jgi:hypothetical protein
MTFSDCWFGYTEGGVAPTEWYAGVPAWWGLPVLTEEVSIYELRVDSRGFLVPWAMFVDKELHFWLNGNYTVRVAPDDKACMEVARTEEGYFVGISRCPARTWSPYGGYSDPFVPIHVVNLRVRSDDPTLAQ